MKVVKKITLKFFLRKLDPQPDLALSILRNKGKSIFLLLAIFISSCSPSADNTLTLNFITTDDLNPDVEGRPSPIVIFIYQLKNKDYFISKDFLSLYENDLLGADMISKREVEIKPSQTYKFQDTLEKNTKFLGVIAAYRNINQAHWRKVIPINVNENSEFTFKFDSKKIIFIPG